MHLRMPLLCRVAAALASGSPGSTPSNTHGLMTHSSQEGIEKGLAEGGEGGQGQGLTSWASKARQGLHPELTVRDIEEEGGGSTVSALSEACSARSLDAELEEMLRQQIRWV